MFKPLLCRSLIFQPVYVIPYSSGAGQNPGGTREPLGLARISVVDGVENEFDASGDTEFLEDPKKIFLDRVLAEVKFTRDLAIAKAFGDESNDLFFPRSEQRLAARVKHAQRGHFGDEIDQVSELLGVGPDLARGDAKKTFAEEPKIGVGDGENATCSRTKSADDEFAVAGIGEKNFRDFGMGQVKAMESHHGFCNICGLVQREESHARELGGEGLKDGDGLHLAGRDAELRVAT